MAYKDIGPDGMCRTCGFHRFACRCPGEYPKLTCAICGKALLRTSEEWWACGDGHGPLVGAVDVRERVAAKERAEFRRKMKEAGL